MGAGGANHYTITGQVGGLFIGLLTNSSMHINDMSIDKVKKPRSEPRPSGTQDQAAIHYTTRGQG